MVYEQKIQYEIELSQFKIKCQVELEEEFKDNKELGYDKFCENKFQEVQ